jgi:PUA-domain protein
MITKVKNRHQLKGKDIKEIQRNLQQTFATIFFDETASVETGEIEDRTIIFVNDEPCFMIYNERILFTLHGLNKYQPQEKMVVVDMGAVKFVTNGADVMAPGIVDADTAIVEGDQVWICDEQHRKPLAVGIALMDGEQMIAEQKGKAISLVHYVGDKWWNLTAKSL